MKDNLHFSGAKSHHDNQAGNFTSLTPLVKEALRGGMWLFNKYNGSWYTPEEFLEKFSPDQYSNYDIMMILQNVVIRDPRAGIRAYHKQCDKEIADFAVKLKDLRDRGQAFELRVFDYNHSKSLGKK